MWGKVSCLRKQHNGRDWASNHRPSDLKSNALTTTPPRPHMFSHTLVKRILQYRRILSGKALLLRYFEASSWIVEQRIGGLSRKKVDPPGQ